MNEKKRGLKFDHTGKGLDGAVGHHATMELDDTQQWNPSAKKHFLDGGDATFLPQRFRPNTTECCGSENISLFRSLGFPGAGHEQLNAK